jgi:alanyl-tRNA synthetase
MKSSDIREKFLQFFESKGHTRVASSSLVPHDDPTLLFTNAGMNQFKDCFLGLDKRAYTRAVSSQKCVRAGGKHNDLENVGYTARHHTFFEMLGNFSFGDYFKRDAIHYAWEFLTSPKWLNIPKDKLTITVYATDDEAFDIWNKEIGVPAERIIRISDNKGAPYASDNFWAMGDTGPCGPCTEIFYDHGAHIWGGPPGSKEEDGDRFIEIWNNVFMQFNRTADGNLHPLPAPSVDTGMGLERISAVMQHVHANYEIDLFQSLLNAAAQAVGCKNEQQPSLRVLADHIRSCSFLIADGVLPSNEGRGYVLRRIIRRAIRHGNKLGAKDVFFYKIVAALVNEMGAAYPELKQQQAHIQRTLITEETLFRQSLSNGLVIFEQEVRPANLILHDVLNRTQFDDIFYYEKLVFEQDATVVICRAKRNGSENRFTVIHPQSVAALNRELKRIGDEWKKEELAVYVAVSEDSRSQFEKDTVTCGFTLKFENIEDNGVISGRVIFKLYDTYGFPVDLTNDIARERNLTLDMDGYERCMEEQRERARAASHFSIDYNDKIAVDGETCFTGYNTLSDDSKVVALFKNGEQVKQLNAGDEGVVVVDKTPFYAESGGQVGDKGVLRVAGGEFVVRDTQKSGSNFLHVGKLQTGSLAVGATLSASVDAKKRQSMMNNHSATHLLHAALRSVLGTHVQQKGSLVDDEKLRFDFSHTQPVTKQELRRIEQIVNEQIAAATSVNTTVTDIESAKKMGAMALFGEKYGDNVRVLAMGENNFSVEFCGGTHVKNTGDIGLFFVTAESGIASGVRRIEACTGQAAFAKATPFFNGPVAETNPVKAIALIRQGMEEQARQKEQQLEEKKKQEKELQKQKSAQALSSSDNVLAQAQDVNGTKVLVAKVDGVDANTLRDLMDACKSKLGTAVVLLACVDGGKVALVAGVTQNTTGKVKAGDLMKEIAPLVGGKGGGRPDMAQGGGADVAGLDKALAQAREWLAGKL